MGFNKRFIDYEKTLKYLKEGNLKLLYRKCDAFVFDDSKSSRIFDLYSEGKTEKEILEIYEQNGTDLR